MSCSGVLPNTAGTPLHHPPSQQTSVKGPSIAFFKFPAARCSFRTKATAEKGGGGGWFAGEIKDKERGNSLYELLGISEEGSFDDIKKAYKQLARKYHPDVSPPDRTQEYTRRFIEVQEAYETLSDPRLRAIYDRDLARGLHLAFSSRRRFQDEEHVERSGWKSRWQDQVAELKRRSTHKDSGENLSWAARMRRQRSRSSSDDAQ